MLHEHNTSMHGTQPSHTELVPIRHAPGMPCAHKAFVLDHDTDTDKALPKVFFTWKWERFKRVLRSKRSLSVMRILGYFEWNVWRGWMFYHSKQVHIHSLEEGWILCFIRATRCTRILYYTDKSHAHRACEVSRQWGLGARPHGWGQLQVCHSQIFLWTPGVRPDMPPLQEFQRIEQHLHRHFSGHSDESGGDNTGSVSWFVHFARGSQQDRTVLLHRV